LDIDTTTTTTTAATVATRAAACLAAASAVINTAGAAADGSAGFSTTATCAMSCSAIAEQPRHGYELIKAIEERFGGQYSPSPGVVYPTLTLLEELGYIRPESADGPRKQFVVTAEGTEFLAANQAVVDQIFARMAEVTRAYGGGPAPEIRRATQNLEAALTIRLGRGPLNAEQVRAVTAILDRAAGEIEQS
jgi:DNA-binding PadR family transcriptional regulator